MKKVVYSWLWLCIALSALSCAGEASIGVTAEKPCTLLLYAYDRGELTLLDSLKAGPDGQVLRLEPPYEGVYLLGRSERAWWPVWLKGGEAVNLEYRDNRLHLCAGEAGRENRALFRWEASMADVRVHAFLHKFLPGEQSVPYALFFDELQAAEVAQEAFLRELGTADDAFSSFMRRKAEADLAFYALAYVVNEGMQIPDSVALPDVYGRLRADDCFQSAEILQLPDAGRMLETYVRYGTRASASGPAASDLHPEYLRHEDCRREYLLSAASRFRFHDEYRALLDRVGEAFFTGRYRERLQAIEEALAWSAPGVQAPDFEAMRPDSTLLRLSDYRGRVVVVDVWATWCEPCKRMMPLYHRLAEELAGDEVVFLNVCVGTWAEWDRWLQLARDFGAEAGTAFVNGWRSDFVRRYRITGVPRYLVFDREGRIVSVNAPNPTTSRLRELILKALESE